jgi:hypothetical protein
MTEWPLITTDPCRLYSGLWGQPEGDISQSYSADTFAKSRKVRQPFAHEGRRYVAMSTVSRGLESAEARAYPIFHSSYRKDAQNELEQSGRKDGYTGKTLTYRGGESVLGLPVVFRSRSLTVEELIDLTRRMYAYGGYFAAQAGSYEHLLFDWYVQHEDKTIRAALNSELEQADLPQSQEAMRAFIESQQQPARLDTQLALF